MTKQKRTKEEQRTYMREWRREHKAQVKATNHRYYERNRSWLNKSRTLPWDDKQIISRIVSGDRTYINIMLRILRPEKDPFIELEGEEDEILD